MLSSLLSSAFFFFNDTATTEIYTLSLHDALPIYRAREREPLHLLPLDPARPAERSEEHTSELQSPPDLVCRLLLEKKNTLDRNPDHTPTPTNPPPPHPVSPVP